jgi:hypothetical protein
MNLEEVVLAQIEDLSEEEAQSLIAENIGPATPVQRSSEVL